MTQTVLSPGDAALRYARGGFPVFPLFEPDADAPRDIRSDGKRTGGCSCQKADCENAGKHPRTGPGGLHHATTDPGQVEYWWRRWREAGVGLRTGCALQGGGFLAVVDVDPRSNGDSTLAELEAEHGTLSETLTVRTGGGGWHYYLSTPEPLPSRKLGDGLDLKAAGGYVVAPPSLHPQGQYVTENRARIAPAPEWLLSRVRASGESGARMVPSDLARLLSGVRESENGGRHVSATRLAGHFLGKRLAPDVVELLLLDWNRKNTPPLPDEEVCKAVADLAEKDAGKPERQQEQAMNAEPDPPHPSLSLRTLEAILSDPDAMKEPEPVVPRLAWPGRVSLLAGREKLGKSTLAAAGAAAASSGRKFLGEPVKAGPVLWVGLEEHLGDTARRFQTFGANPQRVHVLDRLAHPQRDLAAAVEQTGAVLIVVDTLAAFSESMAPDPGSSTAWTPIMAKLTRLARDSGAAVLLLHHARKSDGKYRDSTAIGAGVDAVLELQPGEEASIRKVEAKGRWMIEDCAVRLDGSCYTLAAGELSVDARVLLFVENNPGCSMRQLREGVSGKATLTDAAASQLLARGALEDRGGAVGRQLHPVSRPDAEEAPGHTPVSRENLGDTRGDTVSGHTRVPFPNPSVTERDTPPPSDMAELTAAPTAPDPEDHE